MNSGSRKGCRQVLNRVPIEMDDHRVAHPPANLRRASSLWLEGSLSSIEPHKTLVYEASIRQADYSIAMPVPSLEILRIVKRCCFSVWITSPNRGTVKLKNGRVEESDRSVCFDDRWGRLDSVVFNPGFHVTCHIAHDDLLFGDCLIKMQFRLLIVVQLQIF